MQVDFCSAFDIAANAAQWGGYFVNKFWVFVYFILMVVIVILELLTALYRYCALNEETCGDTYLRVDPAWVNCRNSDAEHLF